MSTMSVAHGVLRGDDRVMMHSESGFGEDVLFHVLMNQAPSTGEHSARVAMGCVILAKALQLGWEERQTLLVAGRLHDLGKLLLPPGLLEKEGALDAGEWAQVRRHPELGEQLVRSAQAPDVICQAIRHHHERWDGKGYPDGLSGGQIPLFSRIMAVCDSFDAMVGHRPYRKSMTVSEALDELRRVRGTQLDPEIVDAFLSLPRPVLEGIAGYNAQPATGPQERGRVQRREVDGDRPMLRADFMAGLCAGAALVLLVTTVALAIAIRIPG